MHDSHEQDRVSSQMPLTACAAFIWVLLLLLCIIIIVVFEIISILDPTKQTRVWLFGFFFLFYEVMKWKITFG